MAYPKSRSVNSALHRGETEGSYNIQGKDWGGVPGGVEFADCGCPVGDCHGDH